MSSVTSTVIIPTYQRSRLLRQTLISIALQKTSQPFEVFVVDDGSTDDTASVCESFAHDINLHYLYQERHGFRAGQARNLGSCSASGNILIFLDAGMIVPSWFVDAHVASHATSAIGVTIGYDPGYNHLLSQATIWNGAPESIDQAITDATLEPTLYDMRESWFKRYADVLSRSPIPWNYCWGGNVSMLRTVFLQLGGFDPTFTTWGLEDVELARRAWVAGFTFRLRRDAAALELPHGRDLDALWPSFQHNANLMLSKHVDPYVELSTIAPFEDVEDLALYAQALIGYPPTRSKVLLSQLVPYDIPSNAWAIVGCRNVPTRTSPSICFNPHFKTSNQSPHDSLSVTLPLFGARIPFPEDIFECCYVGEDVKQYPTLLREGIITEASRVSRLTPTGPGI